LKILCFIDHFGSGGAQRQMVELACGLKQRGNTIEMFIYFPQYDFFRLRIEECQIPVHEYRKGKGFSFGVLSKLSSLMQHGGFDVVLSYLGNSNVYAELAKVISGGPKLVVSERSSHLSDKSKVGAYLRRAIHQLANQVVVNSNSHADWLMNKYGWLRGKVHCIYNGYDIESFGSVQPVPRAQSSLRCLVIGRVGPEKNAINLIKALVLFKQQHGYLPTISWAGRRDSSYSGQLYCEQIDQLLKSNPEIAKHWSWLGERSDIPDLLRKCDVLIHPSLYEGLPNVVCEALIAGRPVLISNVCDHPLLIANSKSGFLFDPYDPQSIADAIANFDKLNPEVLQRLSRNARVYAEENLNLDRMVRQYEALFTKLIKD
jgi:glycosyltransferase involved in cell wall biosynthesis